MGRYNTTARYYNSEGVELTDKKARILAKTGGVSDHYPTNYQALGIRDVYNVLRPNHIHMPLGQVSHQLGVLRNEGRRTFATATGQQFELPLTVYPSRYSHRPQRGGRSLIARPRAEVYPIINVPSQQVIIPRQPTITIPNPVTQEAQLRVETRAERATRKHRERLQRR